jgi:anti-anti-sigma factor
MELMITDLEDGIRKIDLAGRLDIEGADAIDLRFTVLTTTERTFSIIDLAGVEFLASVGIATLIRSAKAARLRNGNMVFLNPRENVAKVLASMRIDQIVPVCYSVEEARILLRASPPALQ